MKFNWLFRKKEKEKTIQDLINFLYENNINFEYKPIISHLNINFYSDDLDKKLITFLIIDLDLKHVCVSEDKLKIAETKDTISIVIQKIDNYIKYLESNKKVVYSKT